MFESSTVNEPSVFEPLRLHCTLRLPIDSVEQEVFILGQLFRLLSPMEA